MTVYNYNVFDEPLAFTGTTQAFGLSDSAIVGAYHDANGYHGFIDSSGTFTTLNDPSGTTNTFAFDVNNAGTVVGYYIDSSNKTHGFIESGGNYTTLDDPSATTGTVPQGISATGLV